MNCDLTDHQNTRGHGLASFQQAEECHVASRSFRTALVRAVSHTECEVTSPQTKPGYRYRIWKPERYRCGIYGPCSHHSLHSEATRQKDVRIVSVVVLAHVTAECSPVEQFLKTRLPGACLYRDFVPEAGGVPFYCRLDEKNGFVPYSRCRPGCGECCARCCMSSHFRGVRWHCDRPFRAFVCKERDRELLTFNCFAIWWCTYALDRYRRRFGGRSQRPLLNSNLLWLDGDLR